MMTREPASRLLKRRSVDARRSAKNSRRQAGRRVNDMLAIVEQQHPIVSKGSDQAGKGISA
jgi:hypothetical protein